ncbi:AbrB/MazE/SpoVT family DNA-binding domain-containing protein [Lacticaseibacillus sharpeae]|uniref:SpoVT-AbrB domain-containing protein n=1 Tax=Lacticaseibacillus sharpeae JCM 1186 = DSM 20505 TaxID=1291052 RepID=A0A0R1ZW18_9LACO|nr:AbrB/MazE/SpoVT family DNA-binding domain-containing protein [Lacticaseibacillus sharpeae]KRM55235.1 hypothetical protein FC18_GL001526 [Lacticaseibacillus sharpeae JCM 1186 = DSM 20505]
MTNSVKLSSRGRVTIPQEIRRELNIKPQTEFTVTAADGKIVLTPLPTADDWEKMFKDTPTETVELDNNGHYDPRKAPSFHNWMQNG